MATIIDVANKAEVSIGTVSNYINGTRIVTKATAKKVQDAIDVLGFTPNANARNLKTSGASNEIGVVLPNTHDSYYSNILAGLEKELSESGFNITLSLSNDVPENEVGILTRMLSKSICGLIVITSLPENTDFFNKYFFNKSIPVVFIDRKIADPDINFLAFDNYLTISSLLNELLSYGYNDIGIMVGRSGYFPEDECVRAYRDFYRNSNLTINEDLICRILPSKESAFRTGIQLIKQQKPRIIIASSSQIGKGLIEAANLIGLYNADDLQVISLGEENWASTSPRSRNIATMRSSYKLGQQAANTIIANINSPIVFEKHQIFFKDKIVEKGLFKNKKNSIVVKTNGEKKKLNALFLSTSDSDAVDSLAFDFKNKTGIHVNITTLAQDTLINAILSGTTDILSKHDILMYDITWASQLAHVGALSDITSYVNANSFDSSIFIDDCLERIGLYNDKYYGIPFLYSPQILLYRKDLFSDPTLQKAFMDEYKVELKPPKTWAMFNAISKFFTKSYTPNSPTEYGTSLAGGMIGSMMPELYSRIWAFGGDIFQNNKPAYTSPQFLKALLSYRESYNYAPSEAHKASIEDTVVDFYSGKTAMFVSYASYITMITNPSISDVGGKFGFAFVPGDNSVLGCWALGISSQCSQKDDAFSFIKWACGAEMSNYFTILDGQSPVDQVYQNDELINLYPWLPLIYNCYPKCRDRISKLHKSDKNIYFLEVERITCQIIREMFAGKLTAEQTVTKLQNTVESIL